VVKALFVLLAILTVESAVSAPYYRFWRGYKRDNHVKMVIADGKKTFVDDPTRPMSWMDFESLVNQWLIPATTSCCAESSLVAYLPVLLPAGKKASALHDEIALIVYKSEEAYKKTREDKANIEAQVYGPLHGDVFFIGDTKAEKIEDRLRTSRSLVPVPFKGEVDLTPNAGNFFLPEVAYDVLDRDLNWQEGHTVFRVGLVEISGDGVEPLNRYLREMKARASAMGLSGYTTLITEKYVIEYFNWNDKLAWSNFLKSDLDREIKKLWEKGFLEIPARARYQNDGNPLSYEPLGFSRAGNIQFTPGEKPHPKAHHPRLER